MEHNKLNLVIKNSITSNHFAILHEEATAICEIW
jgi:hypothetical protein